MKKLSRIKAFNLIWKNPLPLSDSSLKSNFFACWKRQILSCPLKASLIRCCDNWPDGTDKNLDQITKLLGLPVEEDDILLMFFSCVAFLNKKHCLIFLFLLALGAVKMDYFFLENKLGFYGWVFDMKLNQRSTILNILSLLKFLLPSALHSDLCCWKVGLKCSTLVLKTQSL